MPHWSENKWVELSERKRLVRLAAERGRMGTPIPAWWFPVIRDYYEYLKTSAKKAGDNRAYREYMTKQIVFSMLANRSKHSTNYEKNPNFDRYRKKEDRIGNR